MKPQELRIGNYIMVNDVIQQVCELPLPENCTDENTKPIKINKQWLLRFGFTFSKWDNLYYKKKHEIFLYSIGDTEFFPFGGQESVCINHVHELQNLFFALTNEELI
jgi:hypothetical protein